MTRGELVQLIYDYKDDYFKIESLNQYISKTINPNTGDIKFIVFEPQECFTSINKLVELKLAISEVGCSPSNTLRVPFFSGVDSKILANFLEQPSGIFNTKYNIDFNIFPSDFNIQGIKRFINYIEHIYKSGDIDSINSYSSYIKYFKNIILIDKTPINIIIPMEVSEIYNGVLYDDLKKIIKDINDNRK